MESKSWSAADLLQLSGGYWAACALHAGIKLNVFTPLAVQADDGRTLAATRNIDERGLLMLLDALAAMQLLDKREGKYQATPFAAEYLNRTSEKYLGHIIMHHHHLMHAWVDLAESVRSGQPLRDRMSHGDDEDVRESFLMGMFNLAMQIAPKITAGVDLHGRRRFLDVGGGPGTYAIHFCQANPDLSAEIYDLPSTRSFAERTVEKFQLSDRITFQAGNYLSDPIQGKFDVAWLSHILHGEGPEGCAIILRKAMSALEPGSMIMVQEFILDDSQAGPLFPALFSLNMLLMSADGQAYSQGKLIEMLQSAGATDVQRLPIQLPNGAGVIAGKVP